MTVPAKEPVPEQGQLVEVRRRRWVVADVNRSSIAGDGGPPEQHLLTLVSVEDDAFDEELRVIWEIEPGVRILEEARLPEPTGFDPPRYQEALLSAVRWGAVTSADVQALQSPFRSGIGIEDYQLEPLVRAIQMPRVKLLVADDVGLGKTIEAGLVIQELILRHRARTVLVVCPASLLIKWRDEMLQKFGLEFRIVDTDLLRQLRRSRGIHTNPWTHFPRLITSIDWLKRDGPMRLFRDTVPVRPTYPRTYDVLVVDEADNVAPSGSGHYALDSDRTKAVRSIAPHFEHRLFLSATPHNGYPESFTSLLELLDDQRFARGISVNPNQLATVMVLRIKEDIVDSDGNPRFPPRRLIPIEVSYSDEERRVHDLLQQYTGSRQGAARGGDRRYAIEFVLKLLKKRLFSSPAAFAITLEQHQRTLEGGGASRVREEQTERSVGLLRRAIREAEEDYADDDRFEESLGDAIATATPLLDDLADRERELLEEMTKWAERARERPDSKAKALLRWLGRHIKPGGEWSDERVIIFTEYRATQNWLVDILTANGFGGADRLMTLYGGMDTEKRERIKAAFQASPKISPVRILVATDAASEGIDLQNHCHLMIHAEIPWNPNRLQQRIGRIDRYGQKAPEVLIHHFVGAGYQEREFDADHPGGIEGDLEFLMRAAIKVQQIRHDLGRVGPVIASQVEEAMLGRRTRLETAAAEREAEAARRLLRIERDIRERVARLHERFLESRVSLKLTPESVKGLVDVGLELGGLPPLREAELAGVWPDSTGERGVSPVFHMPALGGTWARCSEGLNHPHTRERRPITFDQNVAAGRDDVVLVHLSHRLVEMCQRLLRSEVWAPTGKKRLHRVSARVANGGALEDPAVVAHARLIIQGGRGHRLHEEVIAAGGVVHDGRLARMNVGQTEAALSNSKPILPPEAALDLLAELWPSVEPALAAAIMARADDRMKHLTHTLARRRDREIADMTEVLSQLKAAIEEELREPEFRQLELWTSSEREQLERNIGALRRRADAIPEEIEREAAVIWARHADPIVRTFPVAVTFVVPRWMV